MFNLLFIFLKKNCSFSFLIISIINLLFLTKKNFILNFFLLELNFIFFYILIYNFNISKRYFTYHFVNSLICLLIIILIYILELNIISKVFIETFFNKTFSEFLIKIAIIIIINNFFLKIGLFPYQFIFIDLYKKLSFSIIGFLIFFLKSIYLITFSQLIKNSFLCSLQYFLIPIVITASVMTIALNTLKSISEKNIKNFLNFSATINISYILVLTCVLPKHLYLNIITYYLYMFIISYIFFIFIISFFNNKYNYKSIDDYEGLYQKNIFLSCMLFINLIVLSGIPPAFTFIGKLFYYKTIYELKFYNILFIFMTCDIISLYYHLSWIRKIYSFELKQKII